MDRDIIGRGRKDLRRGVEYSTKKIPRVYLSIVVSNEFLDRTVKAILDAGKTGEVGDGKIFVSDIKEAYRIRTGERGNQTLN